VTRKQSLAAGQDFEVTKARILEIERKALAKLRSRSA
jgi:hypothetical protein